MKTRAVSAERAEAPTPVACELCGEHFADEDAFDAHQRPEAARNPPSLRFLKSVPLAPCYSPSTLWSIGWTRARPTKVWKKPPMPKKRAHRLTEDDIYECLLCRKKFNHATPFNAHFVHTHTPIERCLDADELKALFYEQSSTGVYRVAGFTQLLPSQVNRLPTVRAEMDSLEARESAARESRELVSAIKRWIAELVGDVPQYHTG
ncbi:MAG: hypothetical protein ACLPSY_09230 [Steroidobacteraceae bacterium]